MPLWLGRFWWGPAVPPCSAAALIWPSLAPRALDVLSLMQGSGKPGQKPKRLGPGPGAAAQQPFGSLWVRRSSRCSSLGSAAALCPRARTVVLFQVVEAPTQWSPEEDGARDSRRFWQDVTGGGLPRHMPSSLPHGGPGGGRGGRTPVPPAAPGLCCKVLGLISMLSGFQGYKSQFLAKCYCSFPFLLAVALLSHFLAHINVCI